jgi:hypothetical protein
MKTKDKKEIKKNAKTPVKRGRPTKADKDQITARLPCHNTDTDEDGHIELTYGLDFNINEEILNRLTYYIHQQKHSFYYLGKAIGVSLNYFSNVKKNNSSIGSEIIARILYYYKDLSADWLLLGIGNMTRGALSTIEAQMMIKRNQEFSKLNKIVEELNEQIVVLKKFSEETFQTLRKEGTLGILPGSNY